MWWNYASTTKHTFEWIKNQHMAIKIPNRWHVMVCSSNFSSFEISHLDLIKFGPHNQINLQQTQSHIWWERVNTREVMTRDDFIQLKDILYLDQKHKQRSWCFHKNLAILVQFWAPRHLKQVFFIQKASQTNGIHVPFTLGIQTPTQCQAMFTFGHNGTISMDANLGQMMWNIICSP